MTTAAEILEWSGLKQGTATKSDIIRAYRLADEGGTIQAPDALKLFRYADPRWHTAMSLTNALVRLGCVAASDD